MRHLVDGGAPIDRGFVIYDRPADYPDKFVVRPFSIIDDARGRVLLQPAVAWLADSLDEARTLVPAGLICFGRDPADEPHIVETWL